MQFKLQFLSISKVSRAAIDNKCSIGLKFSGLIFFLLLEMPWLPASSSSVEKYLINKYYTQGFMLLAGFYFVALSFRKAKIAYPLEVFFTVYIPVKALVFTGFFVYSVFSVMIAFRLDGYEYGYYFKLFNSVGFISQNLMIFCLIIFAVKKEKMKTNVYLSPSDTGKIDGF